MNRNFAIAIVIAAAAAGNAFAEGPIGDSTPFQSTASRAQVQSELAAFRASGINPWAQHYDQLSGFTSGKTRTQVTGEFMANRQEVAARTGEDSGSSAMARKSDMGSGATRIAAQ